MCFTALVQEAVKNDSFYWAVNEQIVKCLIWADRKAVGYVEQHLGLCTPTFVPGSQGQRKVRTFPRCSSNHLEPLISLRPVIAHIQGTHKQRSGDWVWFGWFFFPFSCCCLLISGPKQGQHLCCCVESKLDRVELCKFASGWDEGTEHQENFFPQQDVSIILQDR